MARPSPTSIPEELLSRADFARGLSRQLLTGADGLADVAQETWLSALTKLPGPSNLQAWMRRVAVNHALQARRAAVRRAGRETDAARDEAIPSTVEIVEREEIRKLVVQAVLRLHEPYRRAVLLRFYEDLPPRLIAKRLGVGVETVRTRIKRGVAQIREDLDRECGGRGAWAVALWPVAFGGGPPAPVRWRPRRLQVLAGATAAVAVPVTLLVGLAPEPPPAPGPAPRMAADQTRAAGIEQEHVGPRTPLERTPAREVAPDGADPSQAASVASVRGRVVDDQGIGARSARVFAAAGSTIELRDGEPVAALASATCGADGAFELAGLPAAFVVGALDGTFFSECLVVRPDESRPIGPFQATLILAPGSRMDGLAVDPEGSPIADVELRARVQGLAPAGTSAGPACASYRQAFLPTTRTAADGRFTLALPPGLRARVEGESANALARAWWNLARNRQGGWLRLEFQPGHRLALEVEGAAPDSEGWVDAYRADSGWVSFRAALAERIELPCCAEGDVLCARVRADGFPAAYAPAVTISAESGTLRAVLAPGSELRGEVVDARGEPVVGARVVAEVAFEDGDAWRRACTGDVPGGRQASSGVSDARGAFVLSGLELRLHHIVAIPPGAYDFEAEEWARPGDSAVALVVGEEPARPARLRLRVEDARGLPIERFGYQILDTSPRAITRSASIDPADPVVETQAFEAGTITLIVTAPGFAARFSELTAGEGPQDVVVQLAPERSLDVRFVGPSGAGLRQASLRCTTQDGRPIAVPVDAETTLERVPVRLDGVVHLRGLPEEPVTFELTDPSHTRPFPTTLDLRTAPASVEVAVPWHAAAETVPTALFAGTGESAGIDELAPRELRPMRCSFPDGTRAALTLRDGLGRELVALEWVRADGEWTRAGERLAARGRVREDGVWKLLERAEALPHEWWKENHGRRLPGLCMLFDAPAEETRFELTVTGCEPLLGVLEPAATRNGIWLARATLQPR